MRLGPTLFTAGLAATAAALLFDIRHLEPAAALVPAVVIGPTLLAVLLQLWFDLRAPAAVHAADAENAGLSLWRRLRQSREALAVGLLAATVLAVDLLGLEVAVPLLLCLLLVYAGRVALPYAAISAGVAFAVIDFGLVRVMGTLLPAGRLWHWLGL